MGTFSSPVQLRLAQEKRYQNVRHTIRRATEELATGGFDDFHSQTVGSLSERDLRRVGHPYARKPRVLNIQSLSGKRGFAQGKKTQVTARGRVQDLPINRQTGRLKRGIRLQSKRGGLQYDLFSDAPHARHVLSPQGTKNMRPRGLLGPKGLLRKRHQARHAGIVMAVRKAAKQP